MQYEPIREIFGMNPLKRSVHVALVEYAGYSQTKVRRIDLATQDKLKSIWVESYRFRPKNDEIYVTTIYGPSQDKYHYYYMESLCAMRDVPNYISSITDIPVVLCEIVMNYGIGILKEFESIFKT